MLENSEIISESRKNYFTAWLGGFTTSIFLITFYTYIRLQEICQAYRNTAETLQTPGSIECANLPETLTVITLEPAYLGISALAGVTVMASYRIYRKVEK
jgi:hypothetical protein